MSSTSAAERAATSGPKTQSDSNPHVATPDPHDPTPVKPMQVAIAKKTVVDSDISVIRRKLYTHFKGHVDQTVISDYLSRHAGQEVKFLTVALTLSDNETYMSEDQNAQSHLALISDFLTAYPHQSTSAELWDHIWPPPGPQEQLPLASPVPGIITTTKKKDPQYSSSLAAAAAATATEEMSMPPPQDRTPSKQLLSLIHI